MSNLSPHQFSFHEVAPPDTGQDNLKLPTAVARNAEGALVGYLLVDPHRPSIHDVWVHEEHRRRGVATELLHRARQQYPDLQHAGTLTPEGEAWARSDRR